MICDCGKVEFWREDDRVIVAARDTVAVLSVVRDGAAVKIEHACQTCETLTLPTKRVSYGHG